MTDIRKTLIPLLAILASIVFWGISFISTKVILAELTPGTTAVFRLVPAILALLVLMRIRRESMRIPRNEIVKFIVATLFGIVLYMIFENTGLLYTSPATASMLVASIPVFTLLIESIITRTRIHPGEAACILVSLGGVYLVLFDGGTPDFSAASFKGNLLVLAAMASWIVYTFLTKDLGKRHSSLKLTTIQSLCAIVLYIPFIYKDIPGWHMPSMTVILNLVFLGVFCSALAYVFFLYGLQTLGPVLPSAFLNLIPLVTILTGVIALGDIPDMLQLGGAILIVGSLTVLSLIKSRIARKNNVPSSSPVESNEAVLLPPD